MSLEADLLEQARHLAKREPRRPRQASLRRAVSAAYYALFHLLVREAPVRLLRGSDREVFRPRVGRGFNHSDMKEVSARYASYPPNPNSKLAAFLDGLPHPQNELIDVADAFVQLQQARHEADYNVERAFMRSESQDLISLAENAFDDWKKVRTTVQADAYLVLALLKQNMRI